MSTPAEHVAATPGDDDSQAASSGNDLTFEQRVNQAVDAADKDANGNLVLADDLSDDIKFAARSEKRRRDTQSALAKATSNLSVLEVENEELKKLAMQGGRITLSHEEQEEMNELKHSDPDAWREKMNALEQSATSTMTNKLTEISDAAQTKGTVGERQVLLDAFKHDNPGFEINDDILANDVPPRITRALENGEVTFIEYLGNVKEYLDAGKVINKTDITPDPNLSDIGGSDTPGNDAEEKASDVTYEKAIF